MRGHRSLAGHIRGQASPPALLAAGDRVRFDPVRPEDLPPSPPPPSPRALPAAGRPTFRVLRPGLLTTVQGGPQWGLGASGLPPGLRFDNTFGVISGTPITSGTFQVHLEARNNYGSAFGEVFTTIQNVAIITGTASAPALRIARSGNDFLVSWPAASSGFVLEEAGLTPNTWSNSSATVGVAASNKVASVPLQNTAKFFRLRKSSQ